MESQPDAKPVNDPISAAAIGVATAIHVLTVLEDWGNRPLLVAVIGSMVVLTPVNMFITRLSGPQAPSERGEFIRLVPNTLSLLLIGHLAHWSDPVWLWLPFLGLVVMGSRTGVVVRLGVTAALMVGLGLLEAASLTEALGAALLMAMSSFMASVRLRVVESTMREVELRNVRLDAAMKELSVMHERAVAQEKLSALGMLAAGVAHEINNPMSYVTANIRSLIAELAGTPELPPTLQEYRDEVLPETLDGIERVNGIVADMRRFARGDAASFGPYDLNEEVQAACRMARSKFAPDQRLKLSLGELPALTGHGRQIAQVVLNLVVNAVQASPPDGAVRVASRRDGEGVVLCVSDDGAGMTEATRRKLFQPFFTTKPAGVGTGLGLTVIQGIVAAHGGTICVESELGKGSTFTVRIPPCPPANTRAPERTIEGATLPPTQRMAHRA